MLPKKVASTTRMNAEDLQSLMQEAKALREQMVAHEQVLKEKIQGSTRQAERSPDVYERPNG